MSSRPARAPRGIALRAVGTALLSGLLLIGCSGADVDWDSLKQTVQEGVESAKGSVDDIRATAADAGLDAETLTDVRDVTASAGEAIDQARAALDSASTAGETASTAIAEAKAALESARAQVEELAGRVSGTVGSALGSLAGQLESLSADLETAS